MKISEKGESSFLLTPEDEIVGDKVSEANRILNSIIDKAKKIEIDMKNVRYISSSFVDLLLNIKKKIVLKGGDIILKNCNDRIKELITLLVKGELKILDED